jgi:hypothetical protein
MMRLFSNLRAELYAVVQDVKTLRRKLHVKNPEKVNMLILIPTECRSVVYLTLRDILEDETIVISESGYKNLSSKLMKFVRRVHLCRFSNGLCTLPYKHIWFNYSEILQQKLVFMDILIYVHFLYFVNNNFLHAIKRYSPHYKVFVFVWDVFPAGIKWGSHYPLDRKDVYKVLTFEKERAKKFGWIYTGPCYYSALQMPVENVSVDLCFIGKAKGRDALINECYSTVSANALCTFKVYGNEKNDFVDGIVLLEHPMTYRQVLHEVITCNCILEIVIDGQTGPSLRYFEAVCYNKKLLTNNPAIVDLPFYDERYMRVFKTASDIDVDWVARREPVDYHYDGSFSPIHLVELVRKLSNNDYSYA